MKMMKLIYPLAFALALTLATTGCRNHKPYGVTPIPNEPNRLAKRLCRPGQYPE